MAENSNSHLLEGDGIVTNLYYYIWRMKVAQQAAAAGTTGTAAPPLVPLPGGAAVGEEGTGGLNVPSTVILEHNFPKAWYYCPRGGPPGGAGGGGGLLDDGGGDDAGSGDLERKLGREVDTQLILRDFSNDGRYTLEDTGDVVAAYYSTVDVNGATVTRVEYLDFAGVTELLLRRSRRPDGFLQKWVQPSGKYNTVVQAVWSPHMCLVAKRQSRLPLRNRREAMFDRCCTYEGPTHYSNEVFVAPHVKHQIQGICRELVTHLYATQRMAIQRMVLHFKVDNASQIWLLYCSSMRLQKTGEGLQLNLAPVFVRRCPDEEADEQAAAAQLTKVLKYDAYEGDTPVNDADAMRRSLNRGLHTTRPMSANEKLRASLSFGGATGGLGGSSSDAPLELYHPRPPTMGPIGDVFGDPAWAKRYKRQLRVREKRQAAGETSPRPSPRWVAPAPTHTPGEMPPRKPAVPKAPKPKQRHRQDPERVAERERRKERESAEQRRASYVDDLMAQLKEIRKTGTSPTRPVTAAPAPSGAGAAGGEPPRKPPRKHKSVRGGVGRRAKARLYWAVLRVGVLSGTVVLQARARRARDWAAQFLYTVYSHFYCTRTPLKVAIPAEFHRRFEEGWLDRVGLKALEVPPPSPPAATDADGEGTDTGTADGNVEVTLLAVTAPLLLLQNRTRDIIHRAFEAPSSRLTWYFVAQRYILFRQFESARQQQLQLLNSATDGAPVPRKMQSVRRLVQEASLTGSGSFADAPPPAPSEAIAAPAAGGAAP